MMTKTGARFSRVLGFTAGLAATFFAASAFAAFVDGSPGQVEYPNELMVQIASINYEAQLASPGCSIPANTIDTLKFWQTLAQGGLLSGRQIRIYYTDCGTRHMITDIVLKQSP